MRPDCDWLLECLRQPLCDTRCCVQILQIHCEDGELVVGHTRAGERLPILDRADAVTVTDDGLDASCSLNNKFVGGFVAAEVGDVLIAGQADGNHGPRRLAAAILFDCLIDAIGQKQLIGQTCQVVIQRSVGDLVGLRSNLFSHVFERCAQRVGFRFFGMYFVLVGRLALTHRNIVRVKFTDLIAAGLFGLVQAAVGTVDEFGQVGDALIQFGQTDTHGHCFHRHFVVVGQCRDVPAQALSGCHAFLGGGAGQRDNKLLSAVATHRVALAKEGAERVGDGFDRFVANQMAVSVVDLLEVVDVHHDGTERQAAGFGLFEVGTAGV